MRFDDTAAGVEHDEEWEAIAFPLAESFDAATVVAVDYEARDFDDAAPQGAVYALPRPPLEKSSYYSAAERALRDRLYRERTVEVFRNRSLKLYSRVGEMPESFRDRCMAAAEDGADEEAAKLRKRYETKLKQERDQAARAERRVRELEVDVGSRKQQEMVAGAGELLGMFLGGRRRTRSLSGAASRRSTTRRTEERLRSAEDRLRDELEDVERLESQLAGELEAIWERWQKAVWEVEQVDVTLEKNDIRVDEVGLIWGQVRSGARYPRAT
jgi:hypothetical protein